MQTITIEEYEQDNIQHHAGGSRRPNAGVSIEELEQDTMQHPVVSIPDQEWDAIVVGAGPAGSMTARHLASFGHRVLLLDREPFPREKVCGDCLVPDAVRFLQRVGLGDAIRRFGHSVHSIKIFSPSRIDLDVSGEYLTIKRHILDMLIVRGAIEAGAVFCHGKVTDIATDDDGTVSVFVEGAPQALKAKVGVIATGARLGLAVRSGLAGPLGPSAVAARCYVRSSIELNSLVWSYERDLLPGYAWIFPMREGEYNVGVGVIYENRKRGRIDLSRAFKQFITQHPIAKDLMKQAEGITQLRGAVLRTGLHGAKPYGLKNIIAVGETIGSTEPFSGEGISRAMLTGELAAGTIHDALSSGEMTRLEAFPKSVDRELRVEYEGYRAAERWLSKPWLNDFVFSRARKSRFVREVFAEMITNDVDPRTVFSFRGMVKSLFGRDRGHESQVVEA